MKKYYGDYRPNREMSARFKNVKFSQYRTGENPSKKYDFEVDTPKSMMGKPIEPGDGKRPFFSFTPK